MASALGWLYLAAGAFLLWQIGLSSASQEVVDSPNALEMADAAETIQPENELAETTQPEGELAETTQLEGEPVETTQPEGEPEETTQPPEELTETTQPDAELAETTQPDDELAKEQELNQTEVVTEADLPTMTITSVEGMNETGTELTRPLVEDGSEGNATVNVTETIAVGNSTEVATNEFDIDNETVSGNTIRLDNSSLCNGTDNGTCMAEFVWRYDAVENTTLPPYAYNNPVAIPYALSLSINRAALRKSLPDSNLTFAKGEGVDYSPRSGEPYNGRPNAFESDMNDSLLSTSLKPIVLFSPIARMPYSANTPSDPGSSISNFASERQPQLFQSPMITQDRQNPLIPNRALDPRLRDFSYNRDMSSSVSTLKPFIPATIDDPPILLRNEPGVDSPKIFTTKNSRTTKRPGSFRSVQLSKKPKRKATTRGKFRGVSKITKPTKQQVRRELASLRSEGPVSMRPTSKSKFRKVVRKLVTRTTKGSFRRRTVKLRKRSSTTTEAPADDLASNMQQLADMLTKMFD